jgi:hypothetical protein
MTTFSSNAPMDSKDETNACHGARPDSNDIYKTEIINSQEFAARLCLPETWVREQVRKRTSDLIPHIRFGKYVRFRWGSPELEAWIARRMVVGSNGTVGRALGKESK